MRRLRARSRVLRRDRLLLYICPRVHGSRPKVGDISLPKLLESERNGLTGVAKDLSSVVESVSHMKETL